MQHPSIDRPPEFRRDEDETSTGPENPSSKLSSSRKTWRAFRSLNSQPGSSLSHWCRFRINAEQEAWIRKEAQEAEVSSSVLARHLLFRAPLPRKTLPKVNAETLLALNRIGNNLNQSVALVHSRRLPVDLLPVLEKVLAEFAEIRSSVAGIESSKEEKK